MFQVLYSLCDIDNDMQGAHSLVFRHFQFAKLERGPGKKAGEKAQYSVIAMAVHNCFMHPRPMYMLYFSYL